MKSPMPAGWLKDYEETWRTLPWWVWTFGKFTALCYWHEGNRCAARRLAWRLLWHHLAWDWLPGYRLWQLEKRAGAVSNWWLTVWPSTKRLFLSRRP